MCLDIGMARWRKDDASVGRVFGHMKRHTPSRFSLETSPFWQAHTRNVNHWMYTVSSLASGVLLAVNFEASVEMNGSVAPTPFAAGVVPFQHRMLTKQEAAEYFRVEERTIETWMKARLIPYIRIGHTVRFRMSDLLLELDQRFRVPSKRRVP
jgi:excisionase family DNA binding protein